MDDLCEILGPNLKVIRGNLIRQSLQLQTLRFSSKAERMAWISQAMEQLPGNGIIYTLTIRDADLLTDWLRSQGHDVRSYTGRSDAKERPGLEDDLLGNKVKALVATQALGMGFDKSDLSFVFHFQAPGSVVHYYQQVGRAGRALEHAYGVLLAGSEDLDVTNYFIKSAFPSPDEVREIFAALEQSQKGLSIFTLEGQVNIRQGRIKHTLQLLSLESPAPVVKDGSTWRLTAAELSAQFWERVERLTALRKSEQKQMQKYVDLKEGHMAFLVKALDGPVEAIVSDSRKPLDITLNDDLVHEAVKFLNRINLPIEPRKQWPSGGMPKLELAGRIPAEQRNREGMALCLWGEAGLGRRVKAGKYKDNYFDDELVTACTELVIKWNPSVKWVCGVPSSRRPQLVSNFCQRLAANLQLPFVPALVCTENRPEQKTMENSVRQARNVDRIMAIDTTQVFPKGPVLLVDDRVDSKWTLTVAGWHLIQGGTEAVYPLALALAGGGS